MIAFFAFIVAMFVSIVLIPPLIRSAERLAFIDQPDARKVHAAPIPRIGGLAMVAGAVLPMLLWVEPERAVRGYLYGVAILLAFGVWDDRRQLDFRLKFLGQMLAVGVAVLYGGAKIRFVPFAGIEAIPEPASVALSLFALLGVTNAINLADGLDGLAAGTSLLSLGAMALLAYLAGDYTLVVLAMAVMGSIVGFLRFNTHPAQVFMGDTGSQFLGFSIGVLVIVLTQQAAPVLSPAMPLLLLGLPLIDTFVVMAQRVSRGQSPFHPDRNHIHHKLLALGFDHYESVVVIYAIQASLVTLAFVCRFDSDLLVMSLFALALFGIPGLLWLARRGQWSLRPRLPGMTGAPGVLSRLVERARQHAVLVRVPMALAAGSLSVAALWVAARLQHLPTDGPETVLAVAVLLAGLFAWRRAARDFLLLERLVLYVAITALTYYWCNSRPTSGLAASVENLYFLALGACLLVAYRYGQKRRMFVTPTDFLIVLIALMVPTVARTLLPQPYVTEVGIKTLVAFYALELVLGSAAARAWWVRGVALTVVGVLAIRVLAGAVSVG